MAIQVQPAQGYTMQQLRTMTPQQFAALPYEEQKKLYYWYGTGDNWFGVNNSSMKPDNLYKIMSQAKPAQTSPMEEEKTYTSSIPEVTVTAPRLDSNSSQLALETDLSPSEVKEMETPEEKTLHYNDYFGRQNMLDAQRSANQASIPLWMTAGAIGGAYALPYVSAIMNNPIVQTALTADGIRNVFSGNGVQKTWNIGKDIYENGLTGKKAWKFAKSATGDILDITGGIGLLGRGINSGKNFIESGRLKGLYDEVKYGLQDRWQGWNIYKNMKSADNIHLYEPYGKHNTTVNKLNDIVDKQTSRLPLTVNEYQFMENTPFTSGLSTTERGVLTNNVYDNIDNTAFTFMQNGPYTRTMDPLMNGYGKRAFRMGFTPKHGEVLPRSFVNADKQAIAHAPSGSFISADARSVTIPELLEKSKSYLFRRRPYFGNEETYGMSSDAYRFFTKQGQLPGNKLVYAGKTGKFNDWGVKNKNINDLQDAYDNGSISAKQYVDQVNTWIKGFGGRPGHVDPITGKPAFYHPVVGKQKFGGIINYLKFFK